jgi:antibiotic biosynthesis monooxygenase (ABM) superfamily enzyme
MTEAQTKTAVAALITKLKNPSGNDSEAFTAWLVNLMLASSDSVGFWSSEIIPPENADNQVWTLIQRFQNSEQAADWAQSQERRALLIESKSFPNGSEVVISEEIALAETANGIATAITTQVYPGMEPEFWKWLRKIHAFQAKFPGYAGVYIQPPDPATPGQWTTLLRFNSPQDLENWFASPVRLELLAEAKSMVKSTSFQKLTSSFPGWFPLDQTTGQRPPKWKTAILVLLGLFPIVILLKHFLLPILLSILNPTFANAINTMGSVSFVTWVSMPILIKSFNWWLMPEENSTATTIKGCLAAIALFALEIILFWNILLTK